MKKDKLKEVLRIQSHSYEQYRMFAYIIRQLKALGCTYYVSNGNIYAIKGNSFSYPCIVSHMDTVHKIGKDLTVIEANGNLTGLNSFTMQQTGIGGDDKVGIFIALQCLEYFDNIKAAFFRDEEVGCHGSYECDKDFFDDCDFVLQCDRKGYTDFVTSASGVKLSSKAFQKDVKGIISNYGYIFTTGLMTDVMALKENRIKCSMANISCGYYRPHCDDEYVNIYDVFNCLNMVKEIIGTMAGKNYPCDYVAPKYYPKAATKADDIISKYSYKKEIYDDWGYWNESKDEYVKDKEEFCECCQEKAVLEYVAEYRANICEKCITDYVKF